MSSREQILQRLARSTPPFPDAQPPQVYRPMVPVEDTSGEALRARFIENAQKVNSIVHQAQSNQEAVAALLEIIDDQRTISSWDIDKIPIPSLAQELEQHQIKLVGQDAAARMGLTGVDAALAATGSLVLTSGRGRCRAASLLPVVHLAVVREDQIMPHLESWWAAQRENGLQHTRRRSNIVVITGPSRTADIAMQTVMGMHGPRELHIILLPPS